jgi:hypothetical protein
MFIAPLPKVVQGYWLTLWLSQKSNKFFYLSGNCSTNWQSVNKAALANFKGRLLQDGGGGRRNSLNNLPTSPFKEDQIVTPFFSQVHLARHYF